MTQPYVLIMLKNNHRLFYLLDRAYNRITNDAVFHDVMHVQHMVQISDGRQASFDYPEWVKDYDDNDFITMWFEEE